MIQDAVVSNLEIVGEVAKRVSPSFERAGARGAMAFGTSLGLVT
jgi:hypothetical protein